jgi:hypothetical protein
VIPWSIVYDALKVGRALLVLAPFVMVTLALVTAPLKGRYGRLRKG